MQDLISGSVAAQYGNRRIFSRSFLPEDNRKVLKKACRRRNTSNDKVLDGRLKGAQARSWEARRLQGKQAWRLESLNTEKLGVIHSFKAFKLHSLPAKAKQLTTNNGPLTAFLDVSYQLSAMS